MCHIAFQFNHGKLLNVPWQLNPIGLRMYNGKGNGDNKEFELCWNSSVGPGDISVPVPPVLTGLLKSSDEQEKKIRHSLHKPDVLS